ncbi:hypothetical protein IR148_00440 [Dysgonomonas mossii]|uniref:Uncharacterized protein n=1 Tax=Dysgonomonas mossii TaxID=163665 RepID=A0A4Y9IPM7_9BACT|nr:hypothetical protein [Dysgonomonas mossii]MBF0759509.1 hypothetical protein [Dysgonomonas mossii]TFU90480.1 hypothetical protein E4T88_00445 [Dysgonomonas mossii]
MKVFKIDDGGVITYVIAKNESDAIGEYVTKMNAETDCIDHISEVALNELSSIIIHDDLSGKDISLKKLIDREKYTESDIVACSEWS